MSKLFISYRRDDSAYVAGAIYDDLTRKFGKDSVVFDVDSIPLGVDFVDYLDRQVSKCDVLLAIIGDNWLDASDDDGSRRLENTDDFVRLEIESALNRDIPIVPILVGKMSMPKADQLPTPMQPLVRRNAAEVRPGRDMRNDLDQLVSRLEEALQSFGSDAVEQVEQEQQPASLRAEMEREPKTVPAADLGEQVTGREVEPTKTVRWLRRYRTTIGLSVALLCLLGVFMQGILSQAKRAGVRSGANAQMQLFESALLQYELDHQEFPSPSQGLHALMNRLDSQGPYIESVPVDPWGNDYAYERISSDTCQIRSNGEDGVADTDDDITRMVRR